MNATKYNAMLPINIACEVKARGMKYGAVAERAGFSKQQFSDMLNGRKIIKPCDILAISNALEMDVGELFTDKWQGGANQSILPNEVLDTPGSA